ncbi:MAG: phage portal protein [Nitrososphaerales archaeon]
MAFWNDWLKKQIKEEIDDLLKADGITTEGSDAPTPVRGPYSADSLPETPEDHDASRQIGRKAIIDDPYFENLTSQVNYKTKMSRLSNRMLKEVSVRDWLVSAIIQARVDTLLRFSRPEHRRFEMGFRVVKKDKNTEYTQEELNEIAAIEDFIYHCGRREGTPADDRMLFGEFLKLITRDALTFGHVAIEKIKTRGGGLHRFRPLPAESIYLINKRLTKEQIKNQEKSSRQIFGKPLSDNDPKNDQEVNEVPIDYYKYVQMSYNMQPLAHFGDEDLIFKLFNPQNFADSNGYCYSPLELAIINITNHLNVENYNANFFTHGYAARGVLHLKGTVTQAQLMNFRRQFYNSISGQQQAWRTPIVAGLDEVQWVPMSGSAREMEYINFNNHLMRVICSMFQIDPVELGLDYLASANGRSPMQQANNEYKIAYSRERGLYPILMFIEDLINSDILPAIDKSFAEKYKFIFTGYTDETAQTEIAQMQAEMTVWKSMNDLLVQAQKQKLNTPAADLPLNQAFWALVEKNYTRGEIREIFFGDKGASQRKELQYIPGDQAFMAWQQTILAIENAKEQKKQLAAQAEAQAQQQDQEAKMKQEKHEHAIAEHNRKEEKHRMEMERLKAQAAAAAAEHGNILRESAKEFGASKATNIGDKMTANPINRLDEQE